MHEDHCGYPSMVGQLRRLIGLSSVLHVANPLLVRFIDSIYSASDQVPSSAMGGILADVMGLGKTLSILSAILSSQHISLSYQNAKDNKVQEDANYPSGLRSRATLVVVTSIRKSSLYKSINVSDENLEVLDGWKREIATSVDL